MFGNIDHFSVSTPVSRCGGSLLRRFFVTFVFFAALVSWTFAVSADTIRMTGKTASGAEQDVTLDEIDLIGFVAERVYNPYEKRRVRYSGVLLDQLVAKYGDPSVKSVKLTAIDGYRITFEQAEWQEFRILLVTKLRGKRFDLEQKGPARIVFPDFTPDEEVHRAKLPKWLWMIQEIRFE
ncbi:hypothetical protein [Nisaea sp.]|uniref:hypothetical protein n=1 Tax=Nisaea sp. TaxID=2024842 RepID=UPI00329944A2